LRLEPNHGDAHNNLAAVLRDLGRPEEALASYRNLLALGVDFPEAHNNIGLVLSELGQFEEALTSFQRAIAGRPDYPEAHNNMALALQDLGRMADAMASYARAIAADPTYAKAHYNLGNALRAAGRLEAAADSYGRALAANPNYALAHNNLGLAQQEMGQIEAAMDSFRQAIAQNGDYAVARANLGALSDDAGNIEEMERLIGEPDVATGDAIQLYFALGGAYGKQGGDDRAFAQIVKGNRLKRSTLHYDAAAARDHFQQIIETFDNARFARQGAAGDASALPIFILGMPRSGTTLVEQILASHPQVHGAGELHDLAAIAASLPYPAGVDGAAPGLWAELGKDYVDGLTRRAPGKARVCDKMPGNFLRLGLIHLMLPNATIIHCRRDATDTCYSCFSLLFSDGQAFSYDLTELGQYYREYDRLMRHWQALLPGRILDVRYEDVVADLEGSARRLVAHCGLDWNDGCLDFHKTERAVRTASLTQVRQPIYASSIGRWRRHERHLGPLLEALGPLALK
ncbi:MAG: tetratricopeptide repeat protein, partial [Rhodospirillaceae bacterium]|nr:tetratricopeptide repeat protein [Rhodospirillaceae bacterium]